MRLRRSALRQHGCRCGRWRPDDPAGEGRRRSGL